MSLDLHAKFSKADAWVVQEKCVCQSGKRTLAYLPTCTQNNLICAHKSGVLQAQTSYETLSLNAFLLHLVVSSVIVYAVVQKSQWEKTEWPEHNQKR